MKNGLLASAALIPLGIAGTVFFVPASTWRSAYQASFGNARQAATSPPKSTANTGASIPSVSGTNTQHTSQWSQPSPVSQSASNSNPPLVPVTPTSGGTIQPTSSFRSPILNGLLSNSGREIVIHGSNNTPLLDAVGWITNGHSLNGVVGSGTLISSDCILTAASVAELCIGRSGALGSPFFVVDGVAVEIVDIEVDGGWREKLMTFDLAICRLAVPVENLQCAKWSSTPFQDPTLLGVDLYGSVIHCSGYDADIWMASGVQYPLLVDRSGICEPFGEHKRAFWNAAWNAFNSKLLDMEWGSKRDITRNFALGVGVYSWSKASVRDHYGWASECVGTTGVSGGPVWVVTPNGDEVVIGVIGQPQGKEISNTGLVFGGLAGSRITAGAGNNMVQDYSGTTPLQ